MTAKDATSSFKRAITEALAQSFSGWDFSYLQGRMVEEKPDWDYAAMVRDRLAAGGPALDLGTGGGGSWLRWRPYRPERWPRRHMRQMCRLLARVWSRSA